MFGKDAVKKIIRENSFLSAREIKSLLFSSVKKFMNVVLWTMILQ
jgi:hypothetical protein